MSKRVRLDDEAAEEIDAAARWYEAVRPGLGTELLQAFKEACAHVGDSPGAFSLAPGVSDQLAVRRCPVRRFPYAVLFIELPDEIRVLAVAHYRRRPGYWRGRL